MFKTIIPFFILNLVFFLVSCSSKHLTQYKRQNELFKHRNITRKDVNISKINFLNIGNLPKFNNLKNKISSGNIITLNHPSDEKLKGHFRVNFHGWLHLPYGVVVKANGITFTELKKKIRNKYKKFFQRGLNNIKINIFSRRYYIEIRGDIKKPGRYLVTRHEGIDKIIEIAGGIKDGVVKDFMSASLKQQQISYSINLNKFYERNLFDNSFTWTGGDRIYIHVVKERNASLYFPSVVMLSGVNKPGKVIFKRNKDIFYYINKSGGSLPNLDYDQSMIVRQTKKGFKKIAFNLSDMEQIPVINANDRIILRVNSQTMFDKILEQGFQVSSILASLATLIFVL